MKRIFAIFVLIICLFICNEAKAQNDVYLAPDPKTARWSYIETDNTGKTAAIVYYSVESIEGDGVNGNIKLLVKEVPVASPEDTVKSFEFYSFKDGELLPDIFSGFEDNLFDDKLDTEVSKTIQEQYPDLPEDKKREVIRQIKTEFIKVSGETRGIPRYPKIGKLPDYEFQCKISLVNMKVICDNRKIIDKERIQTKAGMFDCFVLEETMTTKSMMMKDVERIKSWYAYGIGMVKEITYDKNGNLLSAMVLNEINW